MYIDRPGMMDGISRLSGLQSRSICAENPTGEKGKGGMAVIRNDALYRSQLRFSMYRWHICDPIFFSSDLKVTIQALGWRDGGRYLPLQDDISAAAFWYQDRPAESMPPLPDKDALEIV